MAEPQNILEFLKEVEADPGLFNPSIVFNRTKTQVGTLTRKELAWVITKIITRSDLQVLLMQARAEAGDTLAIEELEIQINGDPLSKQESKQMGLMGLWTIEGNETAGELLVQLKAITQEQFLAVTQPNSSNGSGTPEQLLIDIGAEAKKFQSYSEYLMAVYNDKLQTIAKPNLAILSGIIKGKYSSVENLYNAAMAGKLDAPAAPEVVAPAAPEVVAPAAPEVVAPAAPEVVAPAQPEAPTKTSIQSVDDVKKEIEAKIAEKSGQSSLFAFGLEDEKKTYHPVNMPKTNQTL